MASIRQIAPADGPYGLYAMDVSYRYDLDRIIERGLGGDQGNMDAILAEAASVRPCAYAGAAVRMQRVHACG